MVKIYLTFTLLLCNFSILLQAQSPIFTTHYVETGEISDIVAHCTTQDGGMIAASTQHPSASTTYFITVIKTDAAGDVQWTRKFPTARPGFRNIVQSDDGTYFLSYSQFPFGYYYEAIRLDQNGNLLFDKRVNLAPGFKVTWQSFSVARNDSGFYVGCSVYDSVMGLYQWNVIELSASGNILWSQNYNANVVLGALTGMELCSNGDLLLLGSAYDFPSQAYHGVVSRISSAGNFLWTTRFAYAGHDLYPVDAEPSGSDFILSVQDYQQSANIAAVDFVKISSTGTLLWQMRYTSTGPNSSLLPHDFISNSANEFTVVAQRSGPALGTVLLKVDAGGQYTSGRFYPGYTITSIESANAWQYSLAGTFDSLNEHYAALMTTDLNGAGCNDTAAAFGMGPVIFTSVTGGSGNLFALVAVNGPLTPVTPNIVEYDRCTIMAVPDEQPHSAVRIYPSPANSSCVVASDQLISTVSFVDVNGRVIKQVQCNSVWPEIDVRDLADGVYIVEVQTAKGTAHQRIVIAHE